EKSSSWDWEALSHGVLGGCFGTVLVVYGVREASVGVMVKRAGKSVKGWLGF
nr:hypothetical protein [Tanacetum cinerariifolium]